MSANTTILYTRGAPAWHDYDGLFTFDDEPTMSEAMIRYGLDYDVRKEPMYRDQRTGLYDLDGNEKIKRKLIDNQFVMVRPPIPGDPNELEMGIVGSNYAPIQNMDIARILDPLTQGVDGKPGWPVESVGILREGQKVIALLRAGEGAVRPKNAGLFTISDNLRHYFLVTDDKAGAGKLTIAYTPVRTECENTEILGLQMSDLKVQLQHTIDVRDQLEFCVGIMARAERAKTNTVDFFERMAARIITPEEALSVFDKAYPEPGKPGRGQALLGMIEDDEALSAYLGSPADLAALTGVKTAQVELALASIQGWERARELQLELRDTAGVLYEKFSDEHPAFGNTAWAAYNAVTELADWRKGTKRAGIASLVGHRAAEKSRAARQVAVLLDEA